MHRGCASDAHKGNPLSNPDISSSEEIESAVKPAPPEKAGGSKKPKARKPSGARKPFEPPTVDQVQAYMIEKGYDRSRRESVKFVAYYGSKGWTVGNSPMKAWKHAVVGWIERDRQRREEDAHKAQKAADAPPSMPKGAPRILQTLENNPFAEEAMLEAAVA